MTTKTTMTRTTDEVHLLRRDPSDSVRQHDARPQGENARNHNGFVKAARRAVKNLPDGWEIVSLELSEVR
jgi:hypothetical protein